MRKHSAIRGVLLVTMPLMILASVALVALRVGQESDRDRPEAGTPPAYTFSLLYAILHDEAHGPLPAAGIYERRLAYLETVLERESYGRIAISSRLLFIPSREIGDHRLVYSNRDIADWILLLEKYCAAKEISYDILVFCPASEAYGPWCTDGPSQGYSHNGKKYLCLEAFLNHAKEEEDGQAVALAIHKILHGFGYNHISQENRPSNLLEWSVGLPKTRIFPLAPREEGTRIILDKHIMKVLGFLPKNKFEEQCPDSEGLTCIEENRYFCANSYDIGCLDSDQDGVVDVADDYLFTPYGSADAEDTDQDGIPDDLDLCNEDEIRLEMNISLKKGKAIVNQDRVDIRLEPASQIRGINIYDAKNLAGFIGFLRRDVRRISGNKLTLDAGSLSVITRLQIFYDSPKGSFYRPFYLYRAPQQIEYVHEKEWYYFSRFGCDIPLGVNFFDAATYDENLDGLPDKERFAFASQITDDYDWDSDGVPDVEDSLPTVHGDCSTRNVKGVPDSDGDGLCDPAYFDFAESVRGMLEGDLAVSVMEDADADSCPYAFGTNGDGCP
jgi:hypothetical protein